jgi:hypothetical protein
MYGLKSSGHHGVQQWRARQPYKSFKSQYGPRYAPREERTPINWRSTATRREKLTRIQLQHPQTQARPVHSRRSPQDVSQNHPSNSPNSPGTHHSNYTRNNRGPIGAAFGASAGIFAIFFFDGIPRVQTDILQKVPFIGSFYHNEIAPEDNPF